MSESLLKTLYDLSAWIIPLVIAITFHEAAHGFIARVFKDNTAYNMGRVTFNPIRHIDRFGTIILPGLLMLMKAPFLFGYAKPVPVNFGALKPQRMGMLSVAIAGPGINIILAFVSALLLHIEAFVTPEEAPWLYMNLYRSIQINLVLAFFNMLPIPPLDGGRVVASLLPDSLARQYEKLEPVGIFIVIGIFLVVPWLFGIDVFETVIGKPVFVLYEFVLHAAGHAQSG